jgi:hypothetical protein
LNPRPPGCSTEGVAPLHTAPPVLLIYKKSFCCCYFWLFCQISFLKGNLFRFVLHLAEMGYSETHRSPRREHFFLCNNKTRSESIPRNFFRTEFRISLASVTWTLQCTVLHTSIRRCVPVQALSKKSFRFFVITLQEKIFFFEKNDDKKIATKCLTFRTWQQEGKT